MGSTVLPYMETKPKLIFFTDFDGTITVDDSNDHMIDNLGFGRDRRQVLNEQVLAETLGFRDAFREMLDSIKTPFNECIEILKKNMKLDPYFEKFYYWAKENNVPIVILSGGMRPVISALLEEFLGHKPDSHVHIVSNQVVTREGKDINSEGGWKIEFHDQSHFGHDKSIEIKPYTALSDNERPILLYAGDGVSDLSAAAETNLLFAKEGKDLVTFCQRRGMPYTTFQNWSTILSTTQDILDGKVTPSQVAVRAKSA
ncbi:Pdp3-interacting factor 1 [Penicillium cinerascens]|uniref:Pdp3-interacting factor 1 n=1 Tax=Penicillium cinerascens TaxID=70096 RepID=A0A9W9J926_9EURO|nr:Pdp3-interacting factor 1 [Penicillium cinerascens]KAJ5190530.1 Pdp3-interacting factor 1 [Penicillium cinerascens]